VTPHVIVIGGGFAGLRAAVTLADSNVKVTLLEARLGLGGRARSFLDPVSHEVVDNGQHLFLAGYQETLRFLERLGTQHHLIFQDHLKVSFVEPGGKVHRLHCPKAPGPWHLLLGLMRLSSLSLKDKLGFWRVVQAVNTATPHPHPLPSGEREKGEGNLLDQETVEGWLTRLGQSERSRRNFWYPLAIATLNEDPSKASALGWVKVLKTLMQEPWPSSRLGMCSIGLSDLYSTAAQGIIEAKGGAIFLNRPVAQLLIEDSRVSGVRCADGSILTPEAVVSALPPEALLKVLPSSLLEKDPVLKDLSRFTTSPIVSINLWLDRPVTQDLFVGMIGTQIQWLFNKAAILESAGLKANYVSLIVSAAHTLIDQPNEKLLKIALEELQSCFPQAQKAKLIRSQVIRERQATVSLRGGMDRYRPGPTTCLSNLFLAGDWTATGLPATIESAVVSGQVCAQEVLKRLASTPVGEYNNVI